MDPYLDNYQIYIQQEIPLRVEEIHVQKWISVIY